MAGRDNNLAAWKATLRIGCLHGQRETNHPIRVHDDPYWDVDSLDVWKLQLASHASSTDNLCGLSVAHIHRPYVNLRYSPRIIRVGYCSQFMRISGRLYIENEVLGNLNGSLECSTL